MPGRYGEMIQNQPQGNPLVHQVGNKEMAEFWKNKVIEYDNKLLAYRQKYANSGNITPEDALAINQYGSWLRQAVNQWQEYYSRSVHDESESMHAREILGMQGISDQLFSPSPAPGATGGTIVDELKRAAAGRQ